MNKLAEKLSEWFGSSPFILLHVVWFAVWLILRMPMELLTLIVSLEAIFLALFVLRAENIQAQRTERLLKGLKTIAKEAEDFSRLDLNASRRIERKLHKPNH